MRGFRVLAMAAVVLTLASVAQAGVISMTDVIAYYSFDDGSSLAADNSGHNYGGTITGTITSVAGISGGAAYFDPSVTSYINLPNSQIKADGNCPTSSFSLNAWVKYSSNTAQEIFSAQSDAAGSSGMVIHTELRPDRSTKSDRFVVRDNTGSDIGSFYDEPNCPEAGVWHNVSMVYDEGAASMKFYIDGDLKGSYTPPNPKDIDTWDLMARIGATANDASRPYTGAMDELYLFKRVLTPTEIHTLASVPEPSSIVLLVGAGLSALLFWRRKR
jgi:hypothetical protein